MNVVSLQIKHYVFSINEHANADSLSRLP